MNFYEGEPDDMSSNMELPGMGDVDPIDSDYNVAGVTADDDGEDDIDDNNLTPEATKISINLDDIAPVPLPEVPPPTLELSGAALDMDAIRRHLAAIKDVAAVDKSFSWDTGFDVGSPDLSPELQEVVDRWAGDDADPDPHDPTRTFMDFREPFDGLQKQVPLADQKVAAALLASYIRERIPKDRYLGVQRNVPYGGGTVRVRMEQDMAERHQYPPDDDQPLVDSTLSMRKRDDEEEGEGVLYNVGTNGVVRRIDKQRPTLERQMASAAFLRDIKIPEGYHDMTQEERADIDRRVMEAIDNYTANSGMEEDAGFNNQPVGPQEVARAIRFAEKLRKRKFEPDFEDA